MLLYIVSKCLTKEITFTPNESLPKVSLIISAYNEEKVIKAKLENSLKINYPKDKLEIIIVSDGSTDKTNQIVTHYAGYGIMLIDIQPNKGKTEGQNVAFNKATGDILVFSDANAIYDQDSVRYLVDSFKDENIGCVVGQLKYINPHNSISGKSEGAYWKYEKKIKEMESKCGSLMGANGSIYAVRKDLFVQLPPDIISDFVEPLKILMKNKRVIYQPKAISRELSSENMKDEFGRKVRIALRGFRGLIYCRQLLNVFKYPEYAFKLLSHKILRWLVPVFMIIAFITNILLIPTHYYFGVLFIPQVLFYLLSYIGYKKNSRFLPFYIPYYFVIVNFAMLIALIKLIKGEKATSWKPVR